MAKDSKTPRKRRPAAQADLAERIVDTAIELAEEIGWDRLRLRAVADRLGVPLTAVLDHYRDLDAVADAWFARAWRGMLATPAEGFAELPAMDRIYVIMIGWFDSLEEHRAVTGQMLRAKLYPSHPHHWVPMVFNLSRTIQWLREAALLDDGGLRRQVEEVGLTALFVATLAVWLRDDSPGQERTRAYLRDCLEHSDRMMARLWRRRPAPHDTEQ